MLPPRFLRHAPLLFVDSPAQESLEQIYGAFNSALLKLHPPLRGHLEGLTNAMIEFYHLNQVHTALVPSCYGLIVCLLWDLHTVDEGLYRMRGSWSHLRREGHEKGMNPSSVPTNKDRTEFEEVFS